MNILSLVPEIQYFPKKWKVVPFDKAFEDVTGGNAKIKQSDYKHKGLLPVIDQGKEHIAGYVDDLDLRCQATLPVVLFGDHTKKFKFVTAPFALGADGVKVLAPCPDLDAKFGYYYLQLVRFPSDTGYSRHFKYLKEVTVPLPPLDDQRRIAAILDKADAIRRKRQESIRLMEEFLRSAFLDMFGDPVTNPKMWPLKTLRELGNVKTGGTPPSAKTGMFGGTIPFVTPGDLESNEAVKRHVTIEGAAESVTVRAGATLVCCIGATIGKMGKAKQRSAFNQQLNAVEWMDEVDDDYGISVLSFFKPQIAACGASTTLPILKKSSFEKIKIPVPPLLLQNTFAKRVATIEYLRTLHLDSSMYMDSFFNSLVQRAFRGEL